MSTRHSFDSMYINYSNSVIAKNGEGKNKVKNCFARKKYFGK